MVTSLTQFTDPRSSSCLTFPLYPPMLSATLQSSFPSSSTLYLPLLSVRNFSVTSKCKLKLLLRNDSFQPNMRTFFKCRCGIDQANPRTEMGMLFSFFREIGLGHEETEMLLLSNPDIAMMTLDLLHARVTSLQSIGFDRVDIFHLVSKRSTVLTAKEIDLLISFLREFGLQLELEKLKCLLYSTEPLFFVGFDQKVLLLLNRGVPHEKIAHVLNNVSLAKAICHRSVDEIETIIDFLNPFGGIGLIVKRPGLLNYDLDNQLIPRIKFLVELSGGDEEATGKVLRKLPAFLSYSVEHMQGHVDFLRTFVGLDDEKIFRIILVFPGIISSSRKRKLHPRIRFLKECGLNSDEIFRLLIRAPLFLGHSFRENIAYKLVFLVKIGYRYRTKDLAVAIGSTTRTSCENLQKVIGLYLNYGFSCADIVAMSKKQPQILQYQHTSLEKKMEYLIEEMGRGIEELLVFPAFLGYQFDARIKRRYEEEKKIRGEGISLNKLLAVSTKTFTYKRKVAKAAREIDNLNENKGS